MSFKTHILKHEYNINETIFRFLSWTDSNIQVGAYNAHNEFMGSTIINKARLVYDIKHYAPVLYDEIKLLYPEELI